MVSHRARVLPLAAVLAAALAGLGGSGCVSKVVYDRAVADAADAKAAADARANDDDAKLKALAGELTAAEALTQDRDARLSELTTSSHNLQAELDESTATGAQLRGALERAGKDVDAILAERGTLSKALDDAKARLEELRKAQASAEVRTEFFRDLEKRFAPLTSAGQLRIESRGTRVVMNVRGDLLFSADKAELRSAGKGALMEIAHALQAQTRGPSWAPTAAAPSAVSPARRFAVTASVDDAPFKSKQFESTWELTSARAIAVVKYLVSLGVPASSLTAGAAGAFDPLVANDTADDRARNRRVEIALIPGGEEPPASAAR